MPAASSLNVLIVDDQQTIRSLVRTGLQQLGFTNFQDASDGEDVSARFASATASSFLLAS